MKPVWFASCSTRQKRQVVCWQQCITLGRLASRLYWTWQVEHVLLIY